MMPYLDWHEPTEKKKRILISAALQCIAIGAEPEAKLEMNWEEIAEGYDGTLDELVDLYHEQM